VKRWGMILFIIIGLNACCWIMYDAERDEQQKQSTIADSMTAAAVDVGIMYVESWHGYPFTLEVVIDCYDSTGKFLGGYRTKETVYYNWRIDGKEIAKHYWQCVRWDK